MSRLPPIRYFARTKGISGYASASRAFALALSASKIKTKFELSCESMDFMGSYLDFAGKPKIDLYLNMPPFSQHKSKNYKIGYFYWETDTLPAPWVSSIRFLDEIWAPCELVASACRNSGFSGPIEVLPTPALPQPAEVSISIPSPISEEYLISDGVFKFYSIFQWHERKGFRELLKAYYGEFGEKDNVILIIKTSKLDSKSYNKEQIYLDIINLKRKLNQKFYPRVYLIDRSIPFQNIMALHKYCDCYVSASHGEGWGMPMHDALGAENLLITPKFGGITEYLDEDSAHIVSHQMGPVKNMGWQPLYDRSQRWAYPSVSSLRKNMREAYSDPESGLKKIEAAKKIAETMSVEGVGRRMEEILALPRFKKYA